MKKELVKSILLFIFSGIFLAIGVIILPEITSFGQNILLFVIAGLILFYVYGYLLSKVKKAPKGVMLVLTLAEMIFLTFVAIIAIANTWISIGDFGNGSFVIGISLWIRGIFETFRAYFIQKKGEKKYPLYKVGLNLFLITLGMILCVGEVLYNFELLYVLCFAFICLSVASIIMGVLKLKK